MEVLWDASKHTASGICLLRQAAVALKILSCVALLLQRDTVDAQTPDAQKAKS